MHLHVCPCAGIASTQMSVCMCLCVLVSVCAGVYLCTCVCACVSVCMYMYVCAHACPSKHHTALEIVVHPVLTDWLIFFLIVNPP